MCRKDAARHERAHFRVQVEVARYGQPGLEELFGGAAGHRLGGHLGSRLCGGDLSYAGDFAVRVVLAHTKLPVTGGAARRR